MGHTGLDVSAPAGGGRGVAWLIRRAFDLCANISAYDATYVALAEALGYELLTADQRLANVTGAPCTIRGLSPR